MLNGLACTAIPVAEAGRAGAVGRSAAGRALDEQAIILAVLASLRHQDTEYDSLLMSAVPREVAGERIRSALEWILAESPMLQLPPAPACHWEQSLTPV